MVYEDGCFCGAVRYRADAAPDPVTHCHCLHCRRTSGAAFVTWAEFPRAAVAFTRGEPVRFTSKEGVMRSFCGACGTSLTYENAATRDRIDVTACSLDDPAAVTPRDHVHHRRKLEWIHLSDGLPVYPIERTGR